MKYLLLYLIVFLHIEVHAQESAVFKLLHSDNAMVDGIKAERYQELFGEESIQSSGLMIFVHRTGKFIAFVGDTVVNVNLSNKRILKSLQMDECSNEWPSLEPLFSTEMKRYRTGAVHAGIPDIKWLVPSTRRLMGHPKQSIALLWKSYQSSADAYEFRVNTMFDDPIVKPIQVNEDRLVLPLDTFTVEEELPYILVGVRGLNDGFSRVEDVGVKFSDTSYFLPDTFEAATAIKALEIAFYLEEHGACEYARAYYEKAVVLSNHSFYKEALTSYKQRCSGRQ
jgi:hypothetical protein